MKTCYCCGREFEDKYIYDIKVKIAGQKEYKQFFACKFCMSFPVK